MPTTLRSEVSPWPVMAAKDISPWMVHKVRSDHQGTPNNANEVGSTITMAIQADRQDMLTVTLTAIQSRMNVIFLFIFESLEFA